MVNADFLADADQLRQRAMASLFDQFADLCNGVVVVDREARIVWMNDHYPKKLRLADAAAAIGKPIEEVIPNSLMREVVCGGRPIMLDIMDFDVDSFVVMRLPLRDDAGQIIGGVGIVLFDDARQLAPVVSRYQGLRADLAEAQRKLAEARRTKYTFASFIGATPGCMAVKQEARRAARTAAPVLILGETGTGKELLAQAIHAASPHADGIFVAVNIAAIPETLLEAEFFGVAPGAYTGAERHGRDGKFKLADGGTLFLDEIGEMSLALQAKLLRALQEHEIEPVGSNQLIAVDVRIIAATSRNLMQEIAAGRFRADLFYRLNVVTLNIPPLRERLDDLPLLCEALAENSCRQLGLPPQNVTAVIIERLRQHSWPGNVRELANVLERALLMAEDEGISLASIERILPAPTAETPSSVATLGQMLAAAELDAIRTALQSCGGNKAQAAKVLGISRATLYEKIAALGV